MTVSGRGATAGGASRPLRTTDVARAAGCSVQQVRDLEALGVLPPAGRSANGYRAFGDEHVLALRAYRGLASAVGPVVARRVLRDARSLPLDEAASLVSRLHVTLTREREEALAARRALLVVRAEGDGAAGSADGPAPAAAPPAPAPGAGSSVSSRLRRMSAPTGTVRMPITNGTRQPQACISSLVSAAVRIATVSAPSITPSDWLPNCQLE